METGVNALAEPCDLITNPTSVGRAYDGNKIKVVDQNGNVLPNHQVGRIAISSYMNMDGYGNQDSEYVVINDDKYLITAETGEMRSMKSLLWMTPNWSETLSTSVKSSR